MRSLDLYLIKRKYTAPSGSWVGQTLALSEGRKTGKRIATWYAHGDWKSVASPNCIPHGATTFSWGPVECLFGESATWGTCGLKPQNFTVMSCHGRPNVIKPKWKAVGFLKMPDSWMFRTKCIKVDGWVLRGVVWCLTVCWSLGPGSVMWPATGDLYFSFPGKNRPERRHCVLYLGFLEISFSLSQTWHSWGHRVGQEAWGTTPHHPD